MTPNQKFRGPLHENVKINCPKHGLQPTYDIFWMETKYKQVGVGCKPCFEQNPILEKSLQADFYKEVGPHIFDNMKKEMRGGDEIHIV